MIKMNMCMSLITRNKKYFVYKSKWVIYLHVYMFYLHECRE